MKLLTTALALGFVPSTLLASPAHHPSHFPPYHYPPGAGTGLDPGNDKLGGVASEASVCSDIGIQMLKDGGNAADSLAATVFCIGTVGMYHSGIGGGGFMLVRTSNGSFEFIDFRETAPAAAFQDMYNNNTNASIYGGLASGVPGEIRGVAHLHQKYGALPWNHTVQPSVKLAREGFRVSEDLVRYMAAAVVGIDNFLVNDPTWALDFAPNGTQVGLGDTIYRKRYANTLETIAEQGPDAFYTGAIAETTIKAIQATGGTMTLEDLANYTVAIRKPAEITYRDYKLHSCSAPSSGTVAMSIFKIIEGYPTIGEEAALNLSTHRLDEAIRFAYGQRSQLGDPLFVPGLDEYQEAMLSDAVAAEVRSKISDFHSYNVSYYDPKGLESLNTPGTSAVATADASGMAISLTTTVNLYFGSHVMVPETGIILNNEMNDFSIPGSSNAFGYIPSPSNFIRPGKRPLSSITPTIAEHANGTLYFVVGAAGGSRIITATVQNLWHVLDQNMTTYEALASPRFHDQLSPDQIRFEYAYNNETVAYMKSLGHNVTWMAPGSSSAQGVRILPNGTFEAAGEPRQLNSGGYAI
ncbi:gamma-glutamyltranspeptidase [Polychaeton citri CBS 116435]|uniref:Glutathione hydrolase n=1 Tax=Polychaeton citri CBS 116435 TaxID=1314669 RepID=A0A9P4UUB1_9PEZI|nr:gamma-glutamyltranspeptidase [Polychaeton citri CBS 116435]